MNNILLHCKPAITRVIFTILIPLMLCASVWCQSSSTKASLQSSTFKEDTAKVTALLFEGDRLNTTLPDSAMHYYEEARLLAEKWNWDGGRSKYIRHAIEVLNNQGKYRQALELTQQGLEIAIHIGDQKELAIAYNNLGNEYQYLGYLSLAAENYLHAAELAQAFHGQRFLKVFDNNLASVFYSLQQYDKSYQYAHQSWQIARDMRDSAGMAMSLVNMGISEFRLGRPSQGLEHFNQVIDLGKCLNDYTLICDGYTNIGSIDMNAHHLEQAFADYEKVLELAEKNDNPNYKILSLAGLTDVYIERKEWKKAAPTVQKAIVLTEDIGDRDKLVELYDKSAKINEGLGNWKGALVDRNRYERLNDSLLNEQTRTHINEMDIRYQAARKDQQLAEEHLRLAAIQNLVRTRNTQLYAMAAGLILLLVLLLLGWRLLLQKQKMAVLRAELKGQELERKRIAQEMHDDMGSGLTTILYLGQSLGNDKNVEKSQVAQKIVDTTTSLVETMNEIVWSMNNRYDTLEDLVTYIRHQTGNWMEHTGMNYTMDIPEEVPQVSLKGEVRRNIYLVVKEAMHNVLKHSGACKICLSMNFTNGLFIAIQDDGRGISNNGSRWGNGLSNMEERMKTVGGTLHIRSKGGTSVELHVPI
jgi:signal transduction histidine kinase